MGIYIRNMEMPKECGKCFIGDRTICKNGCPLISVQIPHGRLIDADALINDGWYISRTNYNKGRYELQLLTAIPTIIESEGE